MLTLPSAPRRLEARVTLLCVGTVLPFVVFVIWLAWADLGRQLHDSEKDATAAARILAGEFAQVRRMIAQVLTDFSGISRPDVPLASLCDKTLTEMVSTVPRFQAAVADLNGDVQCGLRHIPPGTNISDREYFHRAIEQRGLATSGFVKGRVSGKNTIVAGFPLYDTAERVRGVVILSIDLSWLQQLIEDIQLPTGASASIVDGAGKIIVQYPETDGVTGTVIPDRDEFIQAISQSDHGVMQSRGLLSSTPVVAGALVHDDAANPAFVRVEIPESIVTQNARALLARGLLTSFIIFLVAAIFAWRFSVRLIGRPLRQLTAASKRVGIEDLSVRTGYVHDGSELGELASSFDHMAERLQRSVRALRALSSGNRTISRPQNEEELLHAMCKVAVEVGGYRTAMVHYALDDEDKTLRLRGHAGNYADCASSLNITWADRQIRRGPPGIAVCTRRHCVVHDIKNDRRTLPWRVRAEQERLESMISFPLLVQEQVIGTYTLMSESTDAFDGSEIELLGKMADDLASGIGTIRAHEEKQRMRDALDYAARHNVTTGLPNRTEVVSRMQMMIADTATHNVQAYVAYIARKHEFLDSLGHEATNDILKAIASRLSLLNDDGVVIGHIALDEFAYVFPGAEMGAATATRIRNAFEQPVNLHGALIEVQAHVGMASYPEHGREADLLLRRAAVAARQAVQRDRHFSVYEPTPEHEQIQRLALVAELRNAITTHELELHYQPKVDLVTLKPVAFEALVRWRRRNGTLVLPANFIPMAEHTGLIRLVTDEVLSLALKELSRRQASLPIMPVAINLTARSLYDNDFITHLVDRTRLLNVSTDQLELEITESALVQDPARAMHTIEYLRNAGFRIYIDDFGTGYSSMSYLVQLPVSGLKIDRTFIEQMTESEKAYAVVASIISLADRLRLEVVAEGVETAEHAEMLRSLKCTTAQGYFFGRPVVI